MKNSVINYTTGEIAGATTRDQRRWEAYVQNNGTVGDQKYDQLVAQLANREPEDVSYIRSVEKKAKIKLLRQGYLLNIGNITYKVVCRGPFASPDAPFTPGVNKLEVVAIPRGELKSCLSELTPVNLDKGPQPVVQSVIDAETGLEWILKAGHTVYVAGRNLAPDNTRADEKAWLEKADGTVAANGTIVESTLQTVNVTFATWPAPGVYKFCLSTRSGMPEEYTLATVRKNVTVVAADGNTNGEG